MSLQAILDQECIDYLPKIKDILVDSDLFSSNQIMQLTLREAMNSRIAIINMNKDQLDKFQDNLINVFKINGWLEKKQQGIRKCLIIQIKIDSVMKTQKLFFLN